MKAGRRTVVELVLALFALIGAVTSGLNVRTVAAVAPIADGEPATTSIIYRPPLLSLTLFLVTVAGVLLVVAVARWRRRHNG